MKETKREVASDDMVIPGVERTEVPGSNGSGMFVLDSVGEDDTREFTLAPRSFEDQPRNTVTHDTTCRPVLCSRQPAVHALSTASVLP